MIHGTPVLDIKPYIADYDSPQNSSVHNNRHKPGAAAQSDGTAHRCDQRLPSGCGRAQPCRSTKEKPDRTSEENSQKSRDTSEIQHILPEDRERAVELALEPSSGESVAMPEDQLGPQELKSFLEEGTDILRKVEGALVLRGRGSSAEAQWGASCHAGTADRVPCSVVPSWVTEAPVPPLRVRFTPHAEMELRKLSSGGELGYLGSPGSEGGMRSFIVQESRPCAC